MTVQLRPLAPGEADAAAAVWLRARKAAFPGVPLPAHPDHQVLAYFTGSVVPTSDVRVAVLDGEIVGVLALRGRDLDHLYVLPEHTGHGIGSALLRLAQELQPELQLWAFQSNAGARRFYARHGFVEVEATDGSTNMERAPDVRMVWPGRREPQPYEVDAVNLDPQADNRIHDDDVAQRFGFAGALVPGVEVFALATAPLVAAWGEAFLAGGRLALRFRRPVYDGERVRVVATPEEDGYAVTVRGPDEIARATGRAYAPAQQPPPGPYVEAALPPHPTPAPQPGPMGAVVEAADPAAPADYVRRIFEPSPLYGDLVHPGLLLRLVNLALMRNVALGPWIHTASDCRFLRPARIGESLTVRSRVTDLFERNGHCYVRYDALVTSRVGPVAEVDHEAIWRLAGASAAAG